MQGISTQMLTKKLLLLLKCSGQMNGEAYPALDPDFFKCYKIELNFTTIPYILTPPIFVLDSLYGFLAPFGSLAITFLAMGLGW